MEEKQNGKYLYGASIQGIQRFIFQTNKLRDIVGGSELVEQICTTAFNEFAKNGDSVVRAAGNIRHIFESKADCEHAVLHFSQKVMTMAPGITISQAVVLLNSDETDFAKKSDELEKLLRVQRNKQTRPSTLGLIAISRSPSTGLPAIKQEREDNKTILLDAATVEKRGSQDSIKLSKKAFGIEKITHNNIAYNVSELTDKNNWIAVIHADGNGVGNVVQEVGKNKSKMKDFSKLLDEATSAAAVDAYNAIADNVNSGNEEFKIPIRPIVLGGDDLTVICRADIAIKYTNTFLSRFEFHTKEKFKPLGLDTKLKDGLTACAGIAFVKATYPFHYAVNLAEQLCRRAKKAAKEIDKDIAPSCLMFHKVQDSFVGDFENIVERELSPQNNLTFEFGPYFNKAKTIEGTTYWTVEKLENQMELLAKPENKAANTHIRQWFSVLYENVSVANQQMKRTISLYPKLSEQDVLALNNFRELDTEKMCKIPFYDILSLLSLQKTNTKKKA